MTPFLSDAARAALHRLAAADAAPEQPDPLSRLRDIRSLTALLEGEAALLSSVRDALSAGESWDAIAGAAGLKPAAARWRWQGSDAEISARQDAGRKRAARPSSVPTDLPGYSVAEAAEKLGVTVQAVYLQVTRGRLAAQTVKLPDGRSYKRVFIDERPEASVPQPVEGRCNAVMPRSRLLCIRTAGHPGDHRSQRSPH